jgi:DNA-binding NtrC family response regulator
MTTKKMNILIVEDDEDLNKAYQMIMATAGHEVSSAYDGKQALEQLAAGLKPDIIFLDLRMPVMDGIAFLKSYHAPSHDAIVVVFSNYDAQDEVDEAFELGAHRYVLKARAAPKELLRIISDISHESTQTDEDD